MSHLSSQAKTALFFLAVVVGIALATFWRQFGNPFLKLTQSPGVKPPSIIKVVDPKLQAGPFSCPSTKEFCQSAKQITKDGIYLGWGGPVASGSSVLATFAGHTQSLETTLPESLGGEKITVVYLDNTQRYLRAVYYFKGKAAKNNVEVTAGEEIGQTGTAMRYYNGANLMIQIIKNDPATGEKLNLTSQDFK